MIRTLNLGLRFVLELVALIAVGYWGFKLPYGLPVQILAGLGLPFLLATLWATFRVPGDGGRPIVAVSGQLRLLLELLVFGAAVAVLAAAGHPELAAALTGTLVVHYAIDYERTLTFLGARLR